LKGNLYLGESIVQYANEKRKIKKKNLQHVLVLFTAKRQ